MSVIQRNSSGVLPEKGLYPARNLVRHHFTNPVAMGSTFEYTSALCGLINESHPRIPLLTCHSLNRIGRDPFFLGMKTTGDPHALAHHRRRTISTGRKRFGKQHPSQLLTNIAGRWEYSWRTWVHNRPNASASSSPRQRKNKRKENVGTRGSITGSPGKTSRVGACVGEVEISWKNERSCPTGRAPVLRYYFYGHCSTTAARRPTSQRSRRSSP